MFSLFDFTGRRRLEAMRPRLYRLAYAWCHDPSLADDLAQETLAKALGRAGQLRDGQALEGWLYAILNNCWRDHLRGCREFVEVESLDELVLADDADPEDDYVRRQTGGRVRAAVAALPLAQRQVVSLVDLEGLSYAQVAEALGVPVGTVMSRLSRARQTLKRMLNPATGQAETRPVLRRVK